MTGTPTGFVDLDRMTSGMHGGELIIVAGRPSMGKTAFSMNVGEYVAVEYGLPVAVFSMEMPGSQLTMRMLGSVGRLDQHRMRTGRLTDEDWPKLTHAVQKMSEAQIFIDETGGLNPMELRSRARRLSRQCGKLGLIIIDYLQLMSGSSSGENRATEISEISRSLKSLAKELDVPGDRACRSSTVVSNSARTSARSCPTCANPALSSRMRTSSCSFTATRSTTRTARTRARPRSSSANSVMVRSALFGSRSIGQFTKFDNFAGAQNFYSD